MESKKAKDNKKLIVAIFSIVIIAVMFLPMLYASIYLGSIWDVYSKLDNVPVAFVNLDKSATKDGKEYAIGKEVENNLKDNKAVGWKFVSLEEAMDGVKGTKYYAVIEIPEDFSQNIVNVQNGKFKNPEIIYIGNKGRNFAFSQVSSTVANSIKTEVSSSIQKEISKSLVDSLFNVKVSINDAGNGAGALQSGTQKLLDGSNALASGNQSAANGSNQLENGLKMAADSTAKLQNGTQKLLNGSNDLSNGLNTAAVGSKQLLAGLKNITNGQSQVVNGSSSLVDGLKSLKSNLTQPNDQVSLLVKGASDLNTKAGTIAQGAGQLDISVSTLTNSINEADSGLHDELAAIGSSNLSQDDKAKLVASITELDQVSRTETSDNSEIPLIKTANSIHQLAGNLQQLSTGTQQISNGVGGLATGLANTQSKAAVGLDQLIGGAVAIQNGSSSILTGLNTVTDKTGDLVNGLGQLNSGSTSLKNGLKTVNDGNVSLVNGLYTADEKTGELSAGLNKLSSGSNSLKDALNAANEGAIKLKDGLNNGYDKISSNLKFNSENMSQFISEPVALKDNSINTVKYYGEGLAPYFMSMSLWIGAMVLSIVLSVVKSRNIFKSKFMSSFIGKFLIGSSMSVLQAVILSFTVIKTFELNPASVTQFYLTNVLIAITFFSVFYGVSHVIGMLASAVMFIVLLLQLSSSGGTFPIETTPAFYRVVNKIVPMTYSVSTLRMTISGINQSVLNHNILVMLIFIAVFLCGGFLIRSGISTWKKKNITINNSKVA